MDTIAKLSCVGQKTLLKILPKSNRKDITDESSYKGIRFEIGTSNLEVSSS